MVAALARPGNTGGDRFGGDATDMRSNDDISPILVVGERGEAATRRRAGHLPARSENLEFVGKLELKGKFGDVAPESIADVAYHKGFAYLNSWNEPTCQRGGTFIVDMRDPAAPKEIGFVARSARAPSTARARTS